MSLKLKAQTALALGVFNLYRVLNYRLGVKIGFNPVQRLTAQLPQGQFFAVEASSVQADKSDKSVKLELTAFGYLAYALQRQYPNWFYSPLTQKTFQNASKPWYQIPDFDAEVGDIKGIWEASRFDWLIELVVKAKQGDTSVLPQIDDWLNDWCKQNPAYVGPNWKCGQEASIRVMHLIAALIGLDRLSQPHANILTLIDAHLQRIAPTINYAIAQDNNHGTSEASALFIGGALLNHFTPKPIYQAWCEQGRKWLENRASKLIMADGGFSQYSVNYHRVMLDSYCLAEILRQRFNLQAFSAVLYQQLKKATDWLYVLTQTNGDVPNLGANDGARLLPVCSTDYRDFRPTVQLASTLFYQHSFYQSLGDYDQILDFFKLKKQQHISLVLPDKNQCFSASGLITAQQGNFFIAFKLPVFKFRPSQCDVLHLDIWWKGQNVLRDGGTYSYNSTPEDLDYFSGVASHNTVQFDNHQQMPRLSRFLFADWLKPVNLTYQPSQFGCAYRDNWGCVHRRDIHLTAHTIEVKDCISGFKRCAVLRWRLQPGDWVQDGQTISNGKIALRISANIPLSIKLVEGIESRYYYQKTKLPVLEVTAQQPATICTIIQELA